MIGPAISRVRRLLLFVLAGVSLLAPAAWSQTASLTRDINTRARGPVSSSFVNQQLVVGGKLFFTAADDSSVIELWVSDGSATGTRMLGDLDASFLGSAGGVL